MKPQLPPSENTSVNTEETPSADQPLPSDILTQLPSFYSREEHNINRTIDDLITNHDGDGINQLIPKMHHHEIILRLPALVEAGADANILVTLMTPSEIMDNFDALLENYNVDASILASHMTPFAVINNIDTLLEHKAKIDLDEIASRLNHHDINYKFDAFIEHGANADKLAARMKPSEIADHLDDLIKHGAHINVNELIPNLYAGDIISNLDSLMRHGADINLIISKLDSTTIQNHRDRLRRYDANV